MVVLARRADHGESASHGDLDGGTANPSGGAVDQQRAARFDALVGHEDHHLLTHQIHFEGDELVDAVVEGSIRHATIFATELHDDPADWQARGLTAPYRTLTCDYVLRPIGFDEVRDPYMLEGFWKQWPSTRASSDTAA